MKRFTAFFLFFGFMASGCDDETNPLKDTKWVRNDDTYPEYVYFDANTIHDYFADDELACYYVDEVPYTVDGNKMIVMDGNEKIEYPFWISKSTLTIISPFENDTLVFESHDFDASALDFCELAKTQSNFLPKK